MRAIRVNSSAVIYWFDCKTYHPQILLVANGR